MHETIHHKDPYAEPVQPVKLEFRGDLELITAPAGEVVSLAQAQEWCNVDEDTDANLIAAMLESAINYCEEVGIKGKRLLRTTTLELPLTTWWYGELTLPRPPLQSVSSVKYYDTNDVLQTLSATSYEVRTPWKQPGTIRILPSVSLPSLSDEYGYTVRVRFVAGYTTATVPAVVKQAIRFLVSQWYDDRRVMPVTEEQGNTVSSLLLGEDWGGYS